VEQLIGSADQALEEALSLGAAHLLSTVKSSLSGMALPELQL
jgi:hypothetical protein